MSLSPCRWIVSSLLQKPIWGRREFDGGKTKRVKRRQSTNRKRYRPGLNAITASFKHPCRPAQELYSKMSDVTYHVYGLWQNRATVPWTKAED